MCKVALYNINVIAYSCQDWFFRIGPPNQWLDQGILGTPVSFSSPSLSFFLARHTKPGLLASSFFFRHFMGIHLDQALTDTITWTRIKQYLFKFFCIYRYIFYSPLIHWFRDYLWSWQSAKVFAVCPRVFCPTICKMRRSCHPGLLMECT